jgi:coatomer protein complex subunit epsilon
MSGEPDDLYTLRNLFWLGNFQLAINEANGMKRCPPQMANEKLEYMYRSYIALGQYDLVISEIGNHQAVSLRGVKILAMVFRGAIDKDAGIVQMQGLLNASDIDAKSIASIQLLLSILHSQDGGAAGANISEAIKSIHSAANLEQMAMLAQLYIRMNRVDFALKQVAKMKAADEDSSLTMMATAWCHLSTLPTPRAQEAGYIFEELADKYGSSAMLLNAQAVAKLHQQQFNEAETLLNSAMEKSPNDPDTLANLIVTGQHLGREEDVTKRYLNQLKKVAPNHQLVAALSIFEGAFDRVGQTLKV